MCHRLCITNGKNRLKTHSIAKAADQMQHFNIKIHQHIHLQLNTIHAYCILYSYFLYSIHVKLEIS